LSVLKSLDINLPKSEKKTLYRFLFLYIFFTLITLSLTISFYYTLQKELQIKQQTISLNQYANEFIIELQDLHQNKIQSYPVDDKFKTSLYDENYNLIYSTLDYPKAQLDQISFTNNKIIRYIKDPQGYYLNTQYVIVQIKEDDVWLRETIKVIIVYGMLFFIFMVIVGYFLLNLFLKPMRDALHLLDTFIKDTTHELNTPISTIMTNIELIDKENIEDKYLLKTINRIDIGAKTISNIYDDLTFLLLNHKIVSVNEEVDLKSTIEQRVEYFDILATIKKVSIQTNLNNNVKLTIDKKKISKLIDNILSNAIKYNKVKGNITITLDTNNLSIEDTGRGIKQEDIDYMFDRYARFDKSVGGFGIGLNIVKMICDEYNLTIHIESTINIGTKVLISFNSLVK